jgi:hypothetical protein
MTAVAAEDRGYAVITVETASELELSTLERDAAHLAENEATERRLAARNAEETAT